MTKNGILYKICPDEQGEYVDAQGRRCNLLVCFEVCFPPIITFDEEGNIIKIKNPTKEEKGFFTYHSLSEALMGLGLTKIDNGSGTHESRNV